MPFEVRLRALLREVEIGTLSGREVFYLSAFLKPSLAILHNASFVLEACRELLRRHGSLLGIAVLNRAALTSLHKGCLFVFIHPDLTVINTFSSWVACKLKVTLPVPCIT